MPLIPLKQTVTVRNYIEKNENGWDRSEWGDPFTLKCRAVEALKVVPSKSVSESLSKVIDENLSPTLTLYFDKIPNLNYKSEITYTNELGETIKKTPISIQPIRMINGKPTLTKVLL